MTTLHLALRMRQLLGFPPVFHAAPSAAPWLLPCLHPGLWPWCSVWPNSLPWASSPRSASSHNALNAIYSKHEFIFASRLMEQLPAQKILLDIHGHMKLSRSQASSSSILLSTPPRRAAEPWSCNVPQLMATPSFQLLRPKYLESSLSILYVMSHIQSVNKYLYALI